VNALGPERCPVCGQVGRGTNKVSGGDLACGAGDLDQCRSCRARLHVADALPDV